MRKDFRHFLLNDSLKHIYPFGEYTIQELLCRFWDEIQTMIEEGVEIDATVSEEMIEEVIQKMVADGTLVLDNEEYIRELVRLMVENGELNIPGGEGGQVASGYSKEYLNIFDYIENIYPFDHDPLDFYSQFVGAINYCIDNKRTLYIPNGDYPIHGEIVIERDEEIGLEIVGESQAHVHLRFLMDSIIFKNSTGDIEPYTGRNSFISLRNLTIERKNRDMRAYKGLRFESFGYVYLDNIRIRDFDIGLSLYNGSEFDMYNSVILGNRLGIYMENPIGKHSRYDLANIAFHSCRIHNNTESIWMNNTRNANFNDCALMNSTGSIVLDGITNIINFNGCIFENQQDVPDLIINSKGIVNLDKCVFSNAYEKKIVLNSDIKLNILQCLFQAVPRPIYINKNANPTIYNTDDRFLHYWCDGRNFTNYNKPKLINVANKDFSTGSCLPFSYNTVCSCDKTEGVTNDNCLYFARNSSAEVMFNLNYKTLPVGIDAKLVEVICSSDCGSANLVYVQFADGTYKNNIECGGADGKTCQFTKNNITWYKLSYKLPDATPDNPITMICVVFPKATSETLVWLDSINVYGEGCLDRLYADAAPTRGYFLKGDVIWAKQPGSSTANLSQSTSTFYGGWVITADNTSGSSAPSFKKFGWNLS